MFGDPRLLLTEKAMLKVAREGNRESKLALLDNPCLTRTVRRILRADVEVMGEAQAVPWWSPVELQAAAEQGSVTVLEAVLRHPDYFPVDPAAHPGLLFPWKAVNPVGWRSLISLDHRYTLVRNLMDADQITVSRELADELGEELGLQGVDGGALEEAVVWFYTDLMQRMTSNPAFLQADQDFLENYLSWRFRLPGDHLAEATRLLSWNHPPLTTALACCWATPVPVLEQLLEQAYEGGDIVLRQHLLSRHTLSAAAKARLWTDPDVRVRAWALNYGLAPAEVMLVLAQDPEIKLEHLPQAPSGRLIYEVSKSYGAAFAQVIWERFGLEVGWYIH
ncbi:hypothetical protein E7T06_05350 [Deinococcus sp. Arct2-2]|uniref:hypothetical protein n=1 Tax=Deinococcus sp. Arct2-2 TaxID=2568653 RepID=UPI0010A3E01B|nr:hypothetical protein [Deinococcus sp. Arct2-2]THF70981.1 hypothetical protein E7T06_05350 [Deinococcus sp. Arct2-2]